MKVNKVIAIMLGVLLVIAVALIAKAANRDNIPPVKPIAKTDVHKAPSELKGKELKEKITADLQEDIKLMQSGNPHDYNKALTGRALRQFQKAYDSDTNAGKIRVRDYKTTELKVIGMQFGVPEAVYKFTDNSHFLDIRTNQPLSQPLNVKREWALGLTKEGDRWKISLIMGAAKRPQDSK